MATAGGRTATAAAATGGQQQQQPKQGGPQQSMQNKRPSRWTGSHSFGNSNANPNSAANTRAQSPLNPIKANTPAPGAAAGQIAANQAAAAPSANITASHDEVAKMHDRMLFLFANLVGHKVRCTLRTGIVYTAILSAVSDADLSICLKLARQVEPPSPMAANGSTASAAPPALPGPPKASLLVSAKDVIDIYAENVSLDVATVSSVSAGTRPTSPNSGASAANQSAMGNILAALGGDTFRTDTDISGTGLSRDQRELKRWGTGELEAGGLEDGLEGLPAGGRGKGGAWDQFAVNERLFGTKTNYQEEIYTTKLDKSGADYKAREARAARIAEEIQSGVALNPHVAEERGGPTSFTDDSGLDEEDKYSGVQRSQGAYVPPGARRALVIQAPPPGKLQGRVHANSGEANGSDVQDAAPARTNSDAKTLAAVPKPPPVAAVSQAGPANPASQSKEGLVGDFKKFVSHEKEKFVQKKSQLDRQNKDMKMTEWKSWSAAFVLKTPVPADLIPILTKDELKQRELANRKMNPMLSAAVASPAGTDLPKPASTHTSPNPQAAALAPVATSSQLASRLAGQPPLPAATQKKASAWAVPSIPPFDPAKAAAARAAKAAVSSPSIPGGKHAGQPAPTSKFNAAAKEFVFRPTAGAFVPGSGVSAATPFGTATSSAQPTGASGPSLARRPSEHGVPATTTPSVPEQPLNPFFGSRVIRNNNYAPFRVKEDFSPFQRNEKLPEPSAVQPAWGFTGKSYKAAASYLFAGPSSIVHTVSPQPSHALPAHMQSNTNGRMLHSVASPPLSSQASHLSRASSSQGVGNHTSSIATSGPSSEDGGIGKSGIATPIPSSNTSATGLPTSASLAGIQAHNPQTANPGHQGVPTVAGQPHMLPQGLVFQPNQQYPTFRYAPGGVGVHQPASGHLQAGQQGLHSHMNHQQQQQFQQMQQQHQQHMHSHQLANQPGTHIIMGPTGQPMTVSSQGQLFSPTAGQPMFNPQISSQIPSGQHFMQPMYVAQQGNIRGQTGQIGTGQHAPQVFYPQMQGSPAMHPQYVNMAQHPGLAITPSQTMFEQPGQQ